MVYANKQKEKSGKTLRRKFASYMTLLIAVYPIDKLLQNLPEYLLNCFPGHTPKEGISEA